jgi:nicotinamide-nucleotide amidase
VGRRYRAGVRCEVLAVGTELLLGQIVDTNSSWIGERLAELGIDTLEHVKVGDNEARIVGALERLLEHADAVIVCGGLGPTPDDITRECLAIVMGRAAGLDGPVPLERRPELVDHIAAMFSARGRDFPANNLRQADVPQGAGVIDNPIGTAPGLRCPVGDKVVYCVPGVPYEMVRMVSEHVLPDLLDRMGERAVILSRTLKTWGASESGLAEMIDDRVQAQTNPTIAFLARGIEGICVRVTAKAASADAAAALVATEEAALRAVLGDLVFAVDDETMEHAVLALLQRRGWTLAVAESVTGGLVSSRICTVPGASATFRGGIVSYATEVKRTLLGVTAEDVVTEEAARQMADGVRRALGADVGIATTGVAGPEPMEGQPVGTVWLGLALPGIPLEAVSNRLPGDRDRIRQFASIGLLNLLRMRLLALDHG